MSLKMLATFLIISQILIPNSIEDDLMYTICDQIIDAAVTPMDGNFVYMITGELFYKLLITGPNETVIESVFPLTNLSKDIRTPIDLIYWTKNEPNYFTLINCDLNRDYIIRFDKREYNGSKPSPMMCVDNWNWVLDFVIDPEDGGQHIVSVENRTTIMVRTFRTTVAKSILSKSDDYDKIIIGDPKLVDNTIYYMGPNKHPVSTVFIHDSHWYFIAGHYYCRVKLNKHLLEECKPIKIIDWIKDCKKSGETEVSKKMSNRDISLYVIILFVIIAIAVIIFVLFSVYIVREYRRQSIVSLDSKNSDN